MDMAFAAREGHSVLIWRVCVEGGQERASHACSTGYAVARAGGIDAMTGKTEPKLLSGGNPQIAKGYGNEPVQAYIAAMPGWKRGIGERLDALIEKTIPDVSKAVKWNTPLYGVEGQGWFLGVHCFTKYVKLTFFKGASLDPVPPVSSKMADTRYVHLHENEDWDEALLQSWIRQAAAIPGEKL
jgi:hypothetical protein